MKVIICCFVCGLSVGSANAGVYKCKTDGKVVYSDVACPNGKTVDITNGKRPSSKDMVEAASRTVADVKVLRSLAQSAAREKRVQQLCNSMARDHASKQQDMMEHPNDVWWKNRVADSQDDLNTYCKGYLRP